MQFLEKLCKMWENIEILNLSQQKEERIIQYHNPIIIPQNFSQNIYKQQKWKKKKKKQKNLWIKKLMYEFWYDYVKAKYDKKAKAKLC